MTSDDTARMAAKLVADGKGILAADETAPTLTRRFDTLGIESTELSRRTYREMLFSSPRCNSAASLGRYTDEMETTPVAAGSPPHRREWRDD